MRNILCLLFCAACQSPKGPLFAGSIGDVPMRQVVVTHHPPGQPAFSITRDTAMRLESAPGQDPFFKIAGDHVVIPEPTADCTAAFVLQGLPLIRYDPTTDDNGVGYPLLPLDWSPSALENMGLAIGTDDGTRHTYWGGEYTLIDATDTSWTLAFQNGEYCYGSFEGDTCAFETEPYIIEFEGDMLVRDPPESTWPSPFIHDVATGRPRCEARAVNPLADLL